MTLEDAYAALADAITAFWLARGFRPTDLPKLRQQVHTAHRDYRDAKLSQVHAP